jgi:hypothetical protein
MTGRHVFLLGLLGPLLLVPATAGAAERLAIHQARTASVTFARDYFAVAFTERTPQVSARCQRATRRKVRCSVELHGDRIDARFKTVVTLRGDDENVVVRASELYSTPVSTP